MDDESRAPSARRDTARRPFTTVGAVYANEAPRLARYFRQRIAAADEVADLVQETFVRVLRASPERPIERPAAYLRRIAQNMLIDRKRSQNRRAEILDERPLSNVDVAVRPDQADGLEAQDMITAYEQALASLPPRTREVFLLHRVDDLAYGEIAERLGISRRTVEWHIAEALVRLRRSLDQR